MAPTEAALSEAFLNENNSAALIAARAIFLALGTLFIILIFISRHLRKAFFFLAGKTHYVLGYVTCAALCIDGLIAPSLGAGTRYAKLLATHHEKLKHGGWNAFYAVPILYSFAVSFPKLSILALYLRIFVDKFSKLACWILFAIISMSCIVNIFTIAFRCGNTPTAAWHQVPGKCNSIQAHLTYAYFPNILTDILILLLPIPVIQKVHVPLHKQISVALTFALASIGLITAIIRFIRFLQNKYAHDPSYTSTTLIIWVTVESRIYLISGCLLSCRPLLGKLKLNPRLSWSGTRKEYS